MKGDSECHAVVDDGVELHRYESFFVAAASEILLLHFPQPA